MSHRDLSPEAGETRTLHLGRFDFHRFLLPPGGDEFFERPCQWCVPLDLTFRHPLRAVRLDAESTAHPQRAYFILFIELITHFLENVLRHELLLPHRGVECLFIFDGAILGE